MTSMIDFLLSIYGYITAIPSMIGQVVNLAVDMLTYPFIKFLAIINNTIVVDVAQVISLATNFYLMMSLFVNFIGNLVGALFDSGTALLIMLGITFAVAWRAYGMVKGKTFAIGAFGFSLEITL